MTSKKLLSCLALTLALSLGAGVGTVLAQQTEEVLALTCPEGDLVYNLEAEIGFDPPGGPRDSSAALSEFAGRAYPGMASAGSIELREENKDRDGDGRPENTYSYKENQEGPTLALARIEKHGDSWILSHFAACNSLLVKYAEGGEW